MEPSDRTSRHRLAAIRSAVTRAAVTMTLVIATLGMAVVLSSDSSVLHFFTAHRTRVGNDLAELTTLAGDVRFLVVAAVLVGLALRRARVSPMLAAVPAIALLAAGALTAIGKTTFTRVRPAVSLRLVAEHDASMPSGHAADSAAFYLALALVLVAVFRLGRRQAGLLVSGAAAVSAAIGVSRLVLGVHWPTDVMVGWTVGTGTAAATAALVSATPVYRWFTVREPEPEIDRSILDHAFEDKEPARD